MKIIKEGKKEALSKLSCPFCQGVFEIDISTEPIPSKCPCCGRFVASYDNVTNEFKSVESIKLETPDSVYPEKYYSYKDGKDFTDEEIRKKIKELIKKYKENNGNYIYSASGNLLIFIVQTDPDDLESYQVIVTKDYCSLDSLELTPED